MAKLIKKGKKKHRGYRGGAPGGSTYPKAKLICEFDGVADGLDTTCQIWLLRAISPDGWMNLKMTTMQRRRKANYWFSWNLVSNRSNGARDLEITMRQRNPALRTAVVQSLKAYVREQQQED